MAQSAAGPCYHILRERSIIDDKLDKVILMRILTPCQITELVAMVNFTEGVWVTSQVHSFSCGSRAWAGHVRA